MRVEPPKSAAIHVGKDSKDNQIIGGSIRGFPTGIWDEGENTLVRDVRMAGPAKDEEPKPRRRGAFFSVGDQSWKERWKAKLIREAQESPPTSP